MCNIEAAAAFGAGIESSDAACLVIPPVAGFVRSELFCRYLFSFGARRLQTNGGTELWCTNEQILLSVFFSVVHDIKEQVFVAE